MSGLFAYRENLEKLGKAGDEAVTDTGHIGFGGFEKSIVYADNVPAGFAGAAAGLDRVVKKRTLGCVDTEKLRRFMEDLRCSFV